MSCPENCGHSGCIIDGLYEELSKASNQLKISDAERIYQKGMIEEYRKDLQIAREDLKTTQYWLFGAFAAFLLSAVYKMI
jgi:hypothetical protein